MGPASPMYRQLVVDPAIPFTTGGSAFDNPNDFSQEPGQLEYGPPAEDTGIELANPEVDVRRAQMAQTLERHMDETIARASNAYNSMGNLAPRLLYLIEEHEALGREIEALEESTMTPWSNGRHLWSTGDVSVRSGKP